ncbi:MAG TPA: hypothetical protein VM597_19865 [Gemmataceae bacterium]|nr:hypothetical protein [Gemmataceae bacterium]
MSRMFELRTHDSRDDVRLIVDLAKVCLVRVETEAGHHFPHLVIRFVDGREDDDTVPPEAAKRFLDAYRAYLTEQPGGGGPAAAIGHSSATGEGPPAK